MGQTAEAAIQLQGLSYPQAVGYLIAAVTLVLGGLKAMIYLWKQIVDTVKASTRTISPTQNVAYDRVKDEIEFRTETVSAMKRIVEMSDAILAATREHNNNSRDFTVALKDITDCMNKGFSETQKGNNVIQNQLILQNGKLATVINELISEKKEKKNGV